ncbi:MAG: hypothetical protein R2774_15300 [Saprospiraceae bacterium]
MNTPWSNYLVMAFVLALLIVNVIFRVRVMKYYKEMVKHHIDFDPLAVFSKNRLQNEVYDKYPQHSVLIQTFVYNIKLSIAIALGLILLLALLAIILKTFA